jgi:phage/plasmid-like protein (TIGR03299 family)
MAHLLYQRRGKDSMMYVGESPWHRLGTKLPARATAAEAMTAAQLDYIVATAPLLAKLKSNTSDSFLKVDSHKAVYDTETGQIYGVVGKDYCVVQNSEVFAFMDSLIERDEAIYETAGSIDGGKRIWMLAKLPDYIRLTTANGREDLVSKYILLASSHDGSMGITAKITPIRVVCNNTLSAALSSKSTSVIVRHTSNAKDRWAQASKVMGLSNAVFTQVAAIFQNMAKTPISDAGVRTYLQHLLPDVDDKDNTIRIDARKTMWQLYNDGAGSELSQGTVWGAYNAATEYVDHIKYANKLNSMAFGEGERFKKHAFELASVLN